MEENKLELNFNQTADDVFKNVFEQGEETTKDQPENNVETQEDEPQVIVEDDTGEQEESPPPDYERHRESSIKKKLSSERRKAYRLEEENRRLSEQNIIAQQQTELLRQQMETSSNAAMYHNEEKLNIERIKLKEDFKKANEIGDYDSAADINVRLGEIGASIASINNYKAQQAHETMRMQQIAAQQQYAQPPYQQQYQEQPPFERDPVQEDWISKNTWISPNDVNHDPDKLEALYHFTNHFESSLVRKGREDLINSPSYYQEIDNFLMKEFPDDYYQAPQPTRQLTMNQSRSSVAPVRGNSSGNYGMPQSSSPNRIRLSSEEKDMAKRMGVTPEAYAKSLLQIKKNDKNAFQQGDFGYLQQHGYVK